MSLDTNKWYRINLKHPRIRNLRIEQYDVTALVYEIGSRTFFICDPNIGSKKFKIELQYDGDNYIIYQILGGPSHKRMEVPDFLLRSANIVHVNLRNGKIYE